MTGQPSPQDPVVAAAAAHWGPRFVHNGTDQADFDETLARISRWDEWCREWGRTAERYEAIANAATATQHHETAAEAWRRAGLCWHWGKFLFVDDPRQQRHAHERAVACYASGAGGLRPPARRVSIPYRGFHLAAYLRLPMEDPGRPRPLVVMVPGLDSVKEELQATAEHFLARGLATLALDGPGQGEAEHDHVIEPAYESVATAAVEYCQSLGGSADLEGTGGGGVDAERIGIFGVSLGGYYAARSMAFEPRLRAGVDLAGPYCFGTDWHALPALTRAAFRERSGARDDDDARARAAELTLAGAAERITHPLLVVHGGQDRIVPISHAHRIAASAPGAQLCVYDDGNHGVTNHAWASRSAIADWLTDQLRA